MKKKINQNENLIFYAKKFITDKVENCEEYNLMLKDLNVEEDHILDSLTSEKLYKDLPSEFSQDIISSLTCRYYDTYSSRY